MKSFHDIDQKLSVDGQEKSIQTFWEENHIFQKSINQRKNNDEYTFFDGPPFATGTPHYGHIVGQTMKDVVPRYWTMRGKHILRKWGWDCHGLPIENIVEKELGSKAKKDIEAVGVDVFNEKCRSKVLEYADEWARIIPRLGRWVDMDNAYRTMDRDYMESVWWVFAQLYEKGLIYESYRSMHICPRCETTLSQSEVSEGYQDIKDLSVIAKFQLTPSQKLAGEEVADNTFVLAWTTTPWTLPGNVALAVGESVEYVKIAQPNKHKNIFLISGKHACASDTYFPKLKNRLEKDGYIITIINHVNPSNPSLEENLSHFAKYDFQNAHIVTHSLGASTFLKFLDDQDVQIASLTMIAPSYPGKPFSSTNPDWVKNSGYVGFDVNFDNITSKIAQAPKIIYSDESIIKKEHFELLGQKLGAIMYYEKEKEHFFAKEYTNEPDFVFNFTSYYICAKELATDIFGDNHETKQQVSGSDLIGLSYIPLYNTYAQDKKLKNRENGWKIYGADFVTTEDGTGVVHIAPAFGEDDMNLGKEKNLPFVQHVGMDGIMKEEVGAPLGGQDIKLRAKGKSDDVREVDILVVKDLAQRGLLFHKEKYTHSYPHCWRCDTALLNYATTSWFVAVTKIKQQLLDTAKEINWSPSHIKQGRFGKWLEGARDWSISRQRFWASVIPVWTCNQCGHMQVFGNVKDLEDVSGQKIDDLHKHIVDNVSFSCSQCHNGVMHRVSDVLDTWFDSGAMPYAQKHYPFENKEEFQSGFPADFIAEGQDQTRAWFYYLHVFAGALFHTHAFRNVIVNGIVLAEDGKKMSKKLKNYPDPMEVVRKYGADTLRMYLMSSPIVRADNLNFNEKEVRELSRGLFRMLRQSYSFFVMYANVDQWSPSDNHYDFKNASILDQWIVARLQQLIGDVNVHMEAYNLQKASRAFAPFVDDLSNWYIRRSRKRFWKSEDDQDKNSAYATLHYVLVELSKLIAPFAPFLAEEIYCNLTQNVEGAKESVHLEDYPQQDMRLVDDELIAQMSQVREIVTQGLELRATHGIKVRQPLRALHITQEVLPQEFVDIILEEMNVKSVVAGADVITLDTEITPELHQEGQAREIIRVVQSARKNAGFNVDDRIQLGYQGLNEVFANSELHDLIAHETLAVDIAQNEIAGADYSLNTTIDNQEFRIWLKKA